MVQRLVINISTCKNAPVDIYTGNSHDRHQEVPVHRLWLEKSGEYQTPFLVNALDLVSKRFEPMDNSWLTKRHSRQYCRKGNGHRERIKAKEPKALAIKGKEESER